MNLALDIGNTRTKIGLFEGRRLAEYMIWTDWEAEQLLETARGKAVENVIVSSVARPTAALATTLQSRFKVIELTHQTPLPFRNAYRTPETLGKDRLAAVAGAQALYPRIDCLIVDCGTCIKYEWLTAEGVYKGGNIAPGLAMRIEAMHHFTARLPMVDLHMPDEAVGYSTETALQNGALRGTILEVEGFADLFRRASKTELQVVLTGGDADFVARHIKIKNLDVQPNLTLIGLNEILMCATG